MLTCIHCNNFLFDKNRIAEVSWDVIYVQSPGNHDKLGKALVSTSRVYASMGLDRVSTGVSVSCWHATPNTIAFKKGNMCSSVIMQCFV